MSAWGGPTNLTMCALKAVSEIPRLANAGEGARGIVAGSCRVTSVFRTFINICRGQEWGQERGKEGRHDLTVHHPCDHRAQRTPMDKGQEQKNVNS